MRKQSCEWGSRGPGASAQAQSEAVASSRLGGVLGGRRTTGSSRIDFGMSISNEEDAKMNAISSTLESVAGLSEQLEKRRRSLSDRFLTPDDQLQKFQLPLLD